MSLQYIIDGYNIVKHPQFSRLVNKRISNKRYALLQLIKTKRLTGSLKNKIILVFDGYPGTGEAGVLDNSDNTVSVVFSGRESADEKIRKLVEKAANPKDIIVVSDDREIRFFIRSYGSRPVGVKEFISPGDDPRLKKEDPWEAKLGYTQMHKINQELRKIWLKP